MGLAADFIMQRAKFMANNAITRPNYFLSRVIVPNSFLAARRRTTLMALFLFPKRYRGSAGILILFAETMLSD